MGEKLVAYVDSFVATTTLVGGVTGRTAEERAEAARREICAILRGQVGHDFTGYKEKTFLRRVQRRMQVVQLGGASRLYRPPAARSGRGQSRCSATC